MKIFYNLITLSLAIITTTTSKVFAQESVAIVKAEWKVAEWQSSEFKTDNDTKVIYAVRNDAKGIHLLIKGGDRMLQAKILMGGMQIMLDPSGKKSKSIGINYPLPGKFDMRQFRGGQRPSDSTLRQRMSDTTRRQRPDSARRGGGRFDMKKMQEQTLAQKKEIELYGFTDENNGLSLVAESPVKVEIGYDAKDTMIYEICFPYNVFTKAPSTGDKLSIGFVVRGMQMPEFGEGNREGGGDRAGGGGGFGGMPPGAMMGGGGGAGGGQMDFMKIFEDNSFWIKHTLTSY